VAKGAGRRLGLVRVVQRPPSVDHATIEDMVITSHHGTGFGAVDTMEFRRALGHFATGVTVVTYAPEDADEFRGTTVNSFTSVSLEPPLVLVSLGRHSRAAAALRPGSAYAVNVLHHGQRDLAMRFARRTQSSPVATDPGQGALVEWEVRAGVPHLAGCGAHFRCVAQDVHGAGDHVLVVGLVEEFQAYGHEPLLFYRGAFEHLRDPLAAPPGTGIGREVIGDFPELW
jgi:flavin reductase (DIM6/NTAB) family NADH-FMN oxidoreductase RutF